MATLRFRSSGRTLQVGKLLCVGRNYPEHAQEMRAPVPTTPIVFLKPSTAVIASGQDVVIPAFSSDLHHEVELVVVIGKAGKHIARPDARGHVAGYAVGLDMTLRDVQADAKKKGLPWTVAKGFDTSAPLSEVVEAAAVADPQALDLELLVNGEPRQRSSTRHMIFTVDHLIEHMSGIFTLEEGDLIFTGTPEGVGPVSAGDRIEARISSVGTLSVGVRRAG